MFLALKLETNNIHLELEQLCKNLFEHFTRFDLSGKTDREND